MQRNFHTKRVMNVKFLTLSDSYADRIAGHGIDRDEIEVIEDHMYLPAIVSKM